MGLFNETPISGGASILKCTTSLLNNFRIFNKEYLKKKVVEASDDCLFLSWLNNFSKFSPESLRGCCILNENNFTEVYSIPHDWFKEILSIINSLLLSRINSQKVKKEVKEAYLEKIEKETKEEDKNSVNTFINEVENDTSTGS